MVLLFATSVVLVFASSVILVFASSVVLVFASSVVLTFASSVLLAFAQLFSHFTRRYDCTLTMEASSLLEAFSCFLPLEVSMLI